MRKLLFSLCLLAALAVPAFNQVTSQNARRLPDKNGVPSGSCVSGPPFVEVQFDVSTTPPTLYACKSGSFSKVTAGTTPGNVVGAASSTDNAAARFDATTGKLVQNSGVIIDDSNNTSGNNFAPGFATTATAAATTTLTVASKGIQTFTGSTTQTVVLPVVTTLPQTGFQFIILNDSSGAVTINSSGGNLVQTVAAGARVTVTCKLLTGTTAASWNVTYLPASFVTNSAGANVVPKSDGTNLVASRITDDGTDISLDVGAGSVSITSTIPDNATFNINGLGAGGALFATSQDGTALSGESTTSNLLFLLTRDHVRWNISNNGDTVAAGIFSPNAIKLRQITNPSGLSAVPLGTPGAQTWRYKIVALLSDGTHSAASVQGSTTVGNATLDGTNFNRVTWSAVAGADSYNVYMTQSGGTPATTGLIANVPTAAAISLRYDHTGDDGDGTSPPTDNTTGWIVPSVAGATDLGTNQLPFSSLYLGNAATNNIQLTGTATGARVATLQDITQTLIGRGASVALTAQAASIGSTALQINGGVAPAGLYRLSYYLVTTTAGTSGTVSATFGWTDLGAARTSVSATDTFGSLAGPVTGTVIIQADGIANITYLTTVTAAVGNPRYALNISLERLQ